MAALVRAIKWAIGDAILTFGWIFCTSAFGAATSIISAALGLDSGAGGWTRVFILTALFALHVRFFDVIAAALGGAFCDPAANAAMYAAGVSSDSLFSLALRFPAQTVGAIGGAIALSKLMPSEYRRTLGGPSIKVDVHTAAMIEGISTFLINFVALIVTLRIRAGVLVKTLLLSMAIVTLVTFGSDYTGASMNPANAFGWAYVKNRHNTWDQFYVYWICPFIGAITAAWLFRVLFSQPKKKEKRAQKNKKAD